MQPITFREIAEAYAVLSDPAKREQYNLGGHAGVNKRWSTEDIFRDFDFGDFLGGRFGFKSIFGDLFGGARQGRSVPAHGADLRHELSLSLEEAATRGEHIISISLRPVQDLRRQRR
jgi:molecular chaperone DnaJ